MGFKGEKGAGFMRAIFMFSLTMGMLSLLGGCSLFYPQGKPENIYFKNPRDVELRISYHLSGIQRCDTDTVTLYEFSEEPATWIMEKKAEKPILLFYAARQREYPNQQGVEYLSIDPPPDKIETRDIDGNRIEFWDLSDQIGKHKDIVITRHFRFKAYETAFRIDPENIGEYDKDDPLYQYYTRTQEFMELTPEVTSLAEKIVGEEKNPWNKARAIYSWCVDNISYKYPPNRGIRFSLPRRSGDCGCYGFIFVSLCRAVGIPARMVNGHWACKAKMNYHVWAEFYLPHFGWIPADPTDGRIARESPGKLAGSGDPFYYFGNLDSGRFISSKGTSIQLYPSPPWHLWGLADTNRNPIFFQTAATVYSGITIEKQKATVEILKGEDVLW